MYGAAARREGISAEPTGLIGSATLLALGGGAAFLGLMGDAAWLDAGLATLMGLIGDAWIWSMAVRPRLEVSHRGLVVVNPVRTIRPRLGLSDHGVDARFCQRIGN